jgi:hypothetical protein
LGFLAIAAGGATGSLGLLILFLDLPQVSSLGTVWMMVCAAGVALGGIRALPGTHASDTHVRDGAGVAAVSTALALIPLSIGGYKELAAVPSEMNLFGPILLIVVGGPWLMLVGTLLAAIITLGLAPGRRKWAAGGSDAR